MKIKRKRTHLLDPRHRNERMYHFVARRHDGFTKVNREGHSRAKIVAHGYGATPVAARLDARKTRKRIERPLTKNARDLADDRRYSVYVHEMFERKARFTPRQSTRMIKWMECEHDWQETLPQSYSYAERCQKCGSKRGRKPGAPDTLRDYF